MDYLACYLLTLAASWVLIVALMRSNARREP